MKTRLIVLAGLGLVFASSAEATLIYSNDFEGGSTSGFATNTGGVAIDQTPAGASHSTHFLGRADDDSTAGFTNDVVTLTLGLGAHTTVTLAFDLYVIRSWDGNGANGGERYLVDASGPSLLFTGFANNDAKDQCFPDNCPASNPTKSGAAEVNTLGYDQNIGGDAVYHLFFTFPHTASTLTLHFIGAGLQDSTTGDTVFPGLTDESWGIDNVTVVDDSVTTAVPAPATLLLIASAVAGLGVHQLRPRRRAR
jgi:hypothetical protein